MGKNGGVLRNWGSMDGGKIFGSLRSWIKYGGIMEGVGEVREVWKSVWGECGGCGKVWEVC